MIRWFFLAYVSCSSFFFFTIVTVSVIKIITCKLISSTHQIAERLTGHQHILDSDLLLFGLLVDGGDEPKTKFWELRKKKNWNLSNLMQLDEIWKSKISIRFSRIWHQNFWKSGSENPWPKFEIGTWKPLPNF